MHLYPVQATLAQRALVSEVQQRLAHIVALRVQHAPVVVPATAVDERREPHSISSTGRDAECLTDALLSFAEFLLAHVPGVHTALPARKALQLCLGSRVLVPSLRERECWLRWRLTLRDTQGTTTAVPHLLDQLQGGAVDTERLGLEVVRTGEYIGALPHVVPDDAA